jgi:serine phosphatase RsbU (regulator of sigma subunit)
MPYSPFKKRFLIFHLKFVFIGLFFILFNKSARSQNYAGDVEFDKQLSVIKNDSVKIKTILDFVEEKELSNNPMALFYSQKAFDLAKKLRSGILLAEAVEAKGNVYWYNLLYSKAIECYFVQLRISDSLSLTRSKARAYYNIGWIKCLQYESFKDRIYLIRSIKMFEKLRDTTAVINSSLVLAEIYRKMGRLNSKYIDSSLIYYRNIIFFIEHRKTIEYEVVVHANYADFLTEIGRYKEAKTYLLKCCEEAKIQKSKFKYIISRNYLARLYFKLDSLKKAKEIYDEVIPFFEKNNSFEELLIAYNNKSKIFEIEKNFEEAYKFHVLFKNVADSITKNVFKSNIMEKENEYEIDKREGNIKKLEQENEISELKNRQNKYVIFGLLFIAVLIIGFAINLIRSNKAKQLANKQLNEKNNLIEEQKKAVEEKNTDITNSINYAKRIQEAILPAKELKYVLFPDAFVLFQPKDIVSGDFYWFAEKNNKRLISAIDCTGHGVPGAFMSMIGNAFLHEAVNEEGITEPGLILNELRTNIITSLKQSEVADSTKDGMDMALLSFNANNSKVEFAGANNPLWLIRNGVCVEYKGDKRPIGYYMGKGLPFTNNVIDLVKGDTLYVFTDGFADQFGGPNGKKYKYKQLKDDLLSIQHLSMAEQELFLLNKFNSWKGNLEQVDDVCVIGVRV